jgi:preprotein translocase subunit YajC
VNGSAFFLLIIAFVFLYFVVLRPQKRRQTQARDMLSGLKPGDEVVTAAGIYGTIVELVDDDDVLVEIAPSVRVRVARRAIGAVTRSEDSEPEEPVDTAPEPPTAENDG